MSFDMITKRRLFDTLWDRARKGQCAPSLRLIAKEFRLPDEAAAERLLRAVAADGAISIVGEVGAYPWLTLRRNTYTGDFIAVPVWLEREKVEKRTIVPAGEQAREPQPQALESRRVAQVPGPGQLRGCSTDRQVNINVPASAHEALARQAAAEGSSVRSVARTIILEACTAPDTRRKHRIGAAVQHACAEDGRPLPEFVTALIELGLEEWRRFRSMPEAAE